MKRQASIGVFVDRQDLDTPRRMPDGRLNFRAYRITMNGRRYSGPQFVSWFTNEILRKNTKPHLRTTSERYRAGTRRTKRLARGKR